MDAPALARILYETAGAPGAPPFDALTEAEQTRWVLKARAALAALSA